MDPIMKMDLLQQKNNTQCTDCRAKKTKQQQQQICRFV